MARLSAVAVTTVNVYSFLLFNGCSCLPSPCQTHVAVGNEWGLSNGDDQFVCGDLRRKGEYARLVAPPSVNYLKAVINLCLWWSREKEVNVRGQSSPSVAHRPSCLAWECLAALLVPATLPFLPLVSWKCWSVWCRVLDEVNWQSLRGNWAFTL